MGLLLVRNVDERNSAVAGELRKYAIPFLHGVVLIIASANDSD